MNTRITVLATAATLVVVAVVGIIDSLNDDRSGPAVLFAALGVGVIGLAYTKARAGTVPVRRDLMSWLETTSAATGESVPEMSDRAISRLRSDFVPREQLDRSETG